MAPENCVLFVGEHLRDWLLLTRVALHPERDPTLRLRLVIPRSYRPWFLNLPNATVESGIPEAHLIAHYQRSLLLMLPLQGAIANNTLLEAMSCVCPILTNRLPSVEEYLGNEGVYFSEGDASDCVQKIESIRKNRGDRASLCAALVDRAARFDWTALRPAYATLYQATWRS